MHACNTPQKEFVLVNEAGYAQLYCEKREGSLLWGKVAGHLLEVTEAIASIASDRTFKFGLAWQASSPRT